MPLSHGNDSARQRRESDLPGAWGAKGHDACYVRFSLTGEEQRQNSLDIDPAPDHLIRIRMVWKGLDAGEADKIAGQVGEQELSPVARESLDGFVAVEWGGTEIGSGRRS